MAQNMCFGTPCNYFVRLYYDDVGILGLVREMCVSRGTICVTCCEKKLH
jgi:hypothetical protein